MADKDFRVKNGIYVGTDAYISNSITSVNTVNFATSGFSGGNLAWNTADGTLDIAIGYGDVVLQTGQETHYVVRNASGSTILNGTSVYCDGVTEGSGRLTANLMLGNGSISPVQYLGLATHDINNGVNGIVTYFGYVRGLDTRGTANTAISVGDENWSVGDKLYVHPTAPGKLTKVEPEAPNSKICVAVVIVRNQSAGKLFVRPTTNLSLDKLSDVQLNTLTNNSALVYSSANSRFEAQTLQSLQGVQGATGAQGTTGVQGTDGTQGITGAQGTVGTQGAEGAQGVQGITGAQGTVGTQGITGAQGTIGTQGITGAQGTIGTQGITGAQGIQGITGTQGITGAQGTVGTQGTIGAQGTTGSQGITGSQGVQGTIGSQGITGAQGVQGTIGSQGITGSQGVQGTIGSQGITGSQGVQGIIGTQGITGTQGVQGVQGVEGTISSWSRKTTNYTAVSKDYLIADTSGGTFTITLPPTPNTGDFIVIADGADFSTINLTIDRNGSTIEGIADNILLDIGSSIITFVYDSTTWEVYVASPGVQGAQGVTGAQGVQGTVGIQGITGAQGVQGSVGTQGATGAQGVQGRQGIQGITGAQGVQGITGAQGVQGTVGTQGATGAQGVQGTVGTQGATGAQGIQGITGAQGVQGTVGTQGATGAQGIQGTVGTQGATGAQGIQGITGAQGVQGTVGTQGAAGAQGIQGITGAQGITGTQGVQGIQGISGPSTTINAADDTTTNASFYPVFVEATGSNQTAKASSTKLYFNPSTGTLNATNFNSLSDVTLKENIKIIKQPFDILDSVNTVSYTWKDTGLKSNGVIAQELEQILPEAVSTEYGLKSVSYNQLLPFAIAAIKELKSRIETLENK